MELTEPQMRRLAFIKYLVNQGIFQSEQPHPLCSFALLIFQDSIELFLGLSCEVFNEVPKDKIPFNDYFDLLDKHFTPDGLAEKVAIKRMNKARVALKHHSIFPSKQDIEDYRASTSDFFKQNTLSIYPKGFDLISLADMVKCLAARNSIRKAEEYFEKGDLLNSLGNLAIAFDQLVEDYNKRKGFDAWSPCYFGKKPFRSSHSISIRPKDSRTLSEVQREISEINRSIDDIRSALEIISLGLDFQKYYNFRLLVPQIVRFASGRTEIRSGIDYDKFPKGIFEYCLNYLIESALKLQESNPYYGVKG